MIKVKETTDLSKYGFSKVDKEKHEMIDETLITLYDWVYCIGHSRRGQFYYVLVYEDRTIHLYASNPDGDGDVVAYPSIILELFKNDELEFIDLPYIENK